MDEDESSETGSLMHEFGPLRLLRHKTQAKEAGGIRYGFILGLLFNGGRYIYNKYKKKQEDATVEGRRLSTAITVITSAIVLGITYALAGLFQRFHQPSLALLFASAVLWVMLLVIISRMGMMVKYLVDKNSSLALRLLRLNIAGTTCLIVMVAFTRIYFPEKFQFDLFLTYIKGIWYWL